MDVSVWIGRFIRKFACLSARIFRNVDNIIRFTQLVYLPEGRPIMDALWEETIDEFEFAGVREILKLSN